MPLLRRPAGRRTTGIHGFLHGKGIGIPDADLTGAADAFIQIQCPDGDSRDTFENAGIIDMTVTAGPQQDTMAVTPAFADPILEKIKGVGIQVFCRLVAAKKDAVFKLEIV
jgi:hypothetical protein